MYFLYIIESINTGRWYIGTTENLEKRLKEHNKGGTKSTRPFRPYKIVYTEQFVTKFEARRREIVIKRSGIIRRQLKEKIYNMAPSSNG